MIELSLIGQVVVWLIVVGVFLAGGEASLFHPVTWYLAFHGLVFILRPILVYCFHFDFILNYIGFEPTDEVFVRTLAISSVGLILFVTACLAMSHQRPSFPASPTREFSVLQRRALLVVTLILFPLIIYSIYKTTNGSEVGQRIGGIYINTNSVGYVNDAQFALMPLLCAWLLVTRFHWLNMLPVIMYIGYRTWFGWARFTIVLFVALVVIVYCWQHRMRWIPRWSLIVAVPLLMLFNLIGHNRDVFKEYLAGEQVRTVTYGLGMSIEQKMRTQYDTADAANFDALSYVVAVVPERTGSYTYGTQYLQLFTEPIPRILWKGKPVGAPVAFFNLNNYGNFTGLTVTLVGDGWMSGGWIGVILTLGLAGAFLGWAHRWFWDRVENNMAALFYLTALPMLAQWYRDGGISVAKFLLWNWLPLFMWLGLIWLMGRRLVPAYSMLLPRGTRIRLLPPG